MGEPYPPLGTLTDRVSLIRQDGTPIATVWGRVRQLSASVNQPSPSHSVVLRFRTDIKPGDLIVYRGRKLRLISASDINDRRAYLSCACDEVRP